MGVKLLWGGKRREKEKDYGKGTESGNSKNSW